MTVRHHLLHSFIENRIDLDGLSDQEEKILLILRGHPITNLPWILGVLIAVFIPILVSPYFQFFPLSNSQLIFAVIFWYAACLSFIATKIFMWYFNLGIVTNKKIIDIDVINLLNSQSTAAVIGKIEEVDKKSAGIFSAIFNYGDVYVQTAGENPNVEFLKIPYPSEVVKIINDLCKKR